MTRKFAFATRGKRKKVKRNRIQQLSLTIRIDSGPAFALRFSRSPPLFQLLDVLRCCLFQSL